VVDLDRIHRVQNNKHILRIKRGSKTKSKYGNTYTGMDKFFVQYGKDTL
jgi:hypothetical protein